MHQLSGVLTCRFVHKIHAFPTFLPTKEFLKRLWSNELVIFQPIDSRLNIFGPFVTTLVNR